jgi:hypothetical protein
MDVATRRIKATGARIRRSITYDLKNQIMSQSLNHPLAILRVKPQSKTSAKSNANNAPVENIINN